MSTVINTTAVLALILGTGIGGRGLVPVAAAEDAAEVLGQLRTALGGEQKLGTVQAFSAEGSFRRLLGPREMEGSLELLVSRDGKMRRLEDLSLVGMTGGPSMERILTLNGDRGWESSNQRGGMGGGMMMMRMGRGPGGPEGSGSAGRPAGQPPTPEEMEKFRGRMMKQELDRWMFAFLASSSQAIAHVGTAEAPDGTADVLEIKDDREQPVRLFVDRTTHLPLMLTYQTVRPRVFTMGGPGGGPGAPGAAHQGAGAQAGGGQAHPDPAEVARRLEAQGPPPPATATLRFSDYRDVNGIKLPHRIEQSIGSDPTEEWVVEKFKINPSIKADVFEKK